MKTIDIFCASQTATSISTTTTITMDSNIHQQPSSSTSAGATYIDGGGGGRAIDRHNPIIQDQKRVTNTLLIPQPPPPSSTTTPNHHKIKKTKNPENIDIKRKTIAFADENNDKDQFITNNYVKNPSSSSSSNAAVAVVRRRQGGVLLGWGCTRPGDFISPATSSRYLLIDKSFSDQLDPPLKQVPSQPPPPEPAVVAVAEKLNDYFDGDNNKSLKKKDDNEIHFSSSFSPTKSPPRSSSSTLSSQSSDHQVVVLRVSLHCKGCEKKMRKHLSKMEGVTSFNIDFLAKKVTVVGHVTPLSVLTSISKVKNAKLLTPTTTISTPPINSDFSEIKKQLGVAR